LESLSKELERYPSVKDNLKRLDSETKKKEFYLQILS